MPRHSWAGFAGDDTARAVFLDKGLDVAVVCNVRCWPCLCSTVEVRSCSSSASWSDVYGGFWKNLPYFLRECVLRSRGRFSPRKSGHHFYKQCLAVASATEAFGRISGVSLREGDSFPEVDFGLVPARFAQGNLDIIPVSFLMTSEGRF